MGVNKATDLPDFLKPMYSLHGRMTFTDCTRLEQLRHAAGKRQKMGCNF